MQYAIEALIPGEVADRLTFHRGATFMDLAVCAFGRRFIFSVRR